MFKSEIATRVKEIIVNTLNIPEQQVTLKTNIVKDLGATALNIKEMNAGLEKEFGIRLTDEQTSSITYVEDILPFIETSYVK